MLPPYDTSKLDIQKQDKRFDDWFMTSYERNVLVALARSIAAETVVETGVQVGNAALEVLLNVPTVTRYVGIDVPKTYRPSMDQQKNEIPDTPGFLVNNNSRFKLLIRPRGSLDLRPSDLPSSDLFLIDGDHGREAVVHDTDLAFTTVRPGGIILWHDYHEGCTVDVRGVLDDMHRRGAKIEHIPGTWFAISISGEKP